MTERVTERATETNDTKPKEKLFDLQTAQKIYVAGHRGLVGSALVRKLTELGLADRLVTRTSKELDLRDQAAVGRFFAEERPDVVILAAARVGGIMANSTYPADFLYDNLMIAANVIHAAHRHDVRKLLNLGSSCIYPKYAEQPMREDALLTGPLEPTNPPYAIAKIAAIELCDAYHAQHGRAFISAMPTNLYGLNDNFDLETSHVLPGLMRKMHEAKERGDATVEVEVWGTGTPRRECLHVDDLANAFVFLLEHLSEAVPINFGTREDMTIHELAYTIAETVGFDSTLVCDQRHAGTQQKLMNASRMSQLGWTARIGLEGGDSQTIDDCSSRHRGNPGVIPTAAYSGVLPRGSCPTRITSCKSVRFCALEFHHADPLLTRLRPCSPIAQATRGLGDANSHTRGVIASLALRRVVPIATDRPPSGQAWRPW